MALGGGTFITQNKVLPGTYINFVSAKSANPSLSDRGIATMPLELDWGIENAVFEVTNEDFEKNALKYFGYSYDHIKLKGLRDLFQNVRVVYCYKLTSGGTKASNDYATAKYSGVRGNDIKITIRKNVDDNSAFDVITMLDTKVMDIQIVKKKEDLVPNDFVEFKTATLTLSAVASSALSGGTNGTVNGDAHQKYLDKIESYSFNAMGVTSTDATIKNLYVSFCKRLRDEVGAKFQTVLYNKAADYFGVVNVKNRVEDGAESSLVFYVTGLIGGCPVNKSNLNKAYKGEFKIDTNFTQNQLAACIKAGEFTFHKVGNEVCVLEDINSKTSVTAEQGDVFKDNQTVRVIDQIANDIAVLFNNKYLGKIPNDNAGRLSLWADIVKHHEELEKIRAIENFSDKDVVVNQGDNKKSIIISDSITVVNTMAQLYMNVKVY